MTQAEGNAARYRQAGEVDREELILDHMPLLHHIVGRMGFDMPGLVLREDLFGWGMLGLIEAADSWDPGRGLQFSTFAYPRIRGAILDELRRQDFLPRGRRERLRELERAVAELSHERGLPPSPAEIAERMGIDAEQVDEILHSARVAGSVSLENGPGDELSQMLTDPKSQDPVGSAQWQETKSILIRSIGGLPQQEQTVITLYYGEELLLKEIGDILGVTESRVSQIHSRALYLLNRQLREVRPAA